MSQKSDVVAGGINPKSPLKPAPREFIPAKPRRAVILGLEWLNRLVALPWLKIRLDFDAESLARLQAIPPHTGIVIACNHPTFADPAIVFEVTRRWGRICNYMAAREIFDRFGSALGRVIRRAGAFSVRRGSSNAYAERFAVRTLRQGRYPIVVYPEGHTFYLNDVLLPLKPGVAAWSLEAANHLEAPPVVIVPLVVKYHYTRDIRRVLDEAVAELEQHLHLSPGLASPSPEKAAPNPQPSPPIASGGTQGFYAALFERLHRIAHTVLSGQERRYGYIPAATMSIDERVEGLCAHILGLLEERYLGQVARGNFFDRARHLMAVLGTSAENSTQTHQDALAARFAWALSTFYAGYLQPDSSPERFAETVMKLQREITHKIPLGLRAWKMARVRVGEPLAVADYLKTYQEDRASGQHTTVTTLLGHLAERMQALLDGAQSP